MPRRRPTPGRTRLLGLLLGGLAVGGLLAAEIGLEAPASSDNDRYLRWLLRGSDFYVGDGRGGLVTNPDLAPISGRIEPIPVAKSRGTLRVFCVGGSTTYGWPFYERLSYPRLLSLMLQDALPERRFEVINAGIGASDSWADRALVREISRLEPDLVILYEGRNEAWNLPFHEGWRAAALKAHVLLLGRSRLYARLHARLAPPAPYDHAAVLRGWVERSRGSLDARLAGIFRRNLGAMIDAARGSGAEVMLLTQVVSPGEDETNPGMLEVNGWIRSLAAERGAFLVDLDREFRARAERSEQLLIPYPVTHPDVAGYGLIARLVAAALRDRGWPVPARAWRWGRVRSGAAYARLLGADDAAYLADIYGRLARLFAEAGDEDLARRYRARAAAPGRLSPRGANLLE